MHPTYTENIIRERTQGCISIRERTQGRISIWRKNSRLYFQFSLYL